MGQLNDQTQRINSNCHCVVPMQVVNSNSDVKQNRNNISSCESDLFNINSFDDISKQKIMNLNCDHCSRRKISEEHKEKCSSDKKTTNNLSMINISCNIDQIQIDQCKFVSNETQNDDMQQATNREQSTTSCNQEYPKAIVSDATCSESTIVSRAFSKGKNSNQSFSGHDSVKHVQRQMEHHERRPLCSATLFHIHPSNALMATHSHNTECEVLPDILNNHILPPYTTLPISPRCQVNAATSVLTHSIPQSVLVPAAPSSVIPVDGRYTFPMPIIRM